MTRTPAPAIAALGLVLQLTTTAFAAEHRLPRPDENIRQTLEHSGLLSASVQPSALEEARARRRSLHGKALATFTVGSTADGACDYHDIQSAIDAAAANGPGLDFIRIAGNQTYTSLALTIDSQDLAIFGGYSDCSDTTADGQTTLRGGSGSVLLVTGVVGETYGVTLRDLVIQQGSASGGGGILVQNGVRVDLDNTRVSANDALIGGGILVLAGADLHLLPGSLVNGNDGVKGGGIYCESSSVEIRYGASIYDNEATQEGGGIYADHCTVVSRAGPAGIFVLGIVGNDSVQDGGGIFATGFSDVELRGTASSTALLGRNTSGGGGGASLTGGAWLRGLNASIVENQTLSIGGGVLLDDLSILEMQQISTVGCNDGGRCSELSRNQAALNHAALWARNSTVRISQTFIEGNTTGNTGILAFTDSSVASLEGVVFTGNRWIDSFGANGAIQLYSGASLVAAFVTTWNNMDAANEALFSGTSLAVGFFSSIVDESVGTIVGNHDPGTSSVSLDCVLGRTESVLGGLGSSTVLAGDPKLIFPANGDFHLKPTSPAIDSCDSEVYTPLSADIDGQTRGFDMLEKLDFLGPYDLGADELAPPDSLFSDGFESGDTSAWSTTLP